MNITITDPKATETHQKYYLTLLNHSGKKSNLGFLIYLVIGLLLISYDLSNFNDCSFKLNTGFLKGKLLNNEMECINLHLSLGIGIGFCLLALSSLLSRSRYKEKASLENWKIYKNLHGDSNKKTIIIDDTGIHSIGESFLFEYKWGLPKHFYRFDNYIAIYTENCFLLCCIINCNLLSEQSKVELLSFLEKNLNEQDVKQVKKQIN